ncbi:calcium-binding mitochondrial carrier protein Aralar2-like isoform X2 [Dendronephthya gigantea]|uniref:calcium-binding mitochondrial carrier protein Aralar2-like isoform X2 n=1 Tax=Dendronephthya gigantea TaxID=151771 RepID=UPI00106D1B19|nr:calcium-binding mitochondrial carrier protein Aralar2-like isoform X2 [Dendronephthya gigantea]
MSESKFKEKEREEFAISLDDSYSVTKSSPEALKKIFLKYASLEEDGEMFMTPEDFIRTFLGMQKEDDYNVETLNLLSGVVDQTKDGLISFSEMLAFESLLCSPDAQFRIVFQLFDLDGKGSVSFDEFSRVIKKTQQHQKFPFNFDSPFITRFFGENKSKGVPYSEFTQLLEDYQKEHIKQAFYQCKLNKGTITAKDFSTIMKTCRPHVLSPYTHEHLLTVAGGMTSHVVTYAYCLAFNDLLDNIKVIQYLFEKAVRGDRQKDMTKEEFTKVARKHFLINPLQIDILFHLCGLRHGTGRISLLDLDHIIPKPDVFKVYSAENHQFSQHSYFPQENERDFHRPYYLQGLEHLYRFVVGGIGGATGVTAVYPIDLVKTRMQNQRAVSAEERLYKNSFDCFFKVLRNEGFRGLYRGIIPQLIGVSPEKAIKLSTNDFVRDRLKAEDGFLTLSAEIVAGGCAGASQVMFTNPIEIVKIRLQVAGESGQKINAVQTVRELGLKGLYKGARACFLRDIPFSAIYFPVYAHLKSSFSDENGFTKWYNLLAAAAIAGCPAAFLCTPFDVIKTRLQVKARQGQESYRGVFDAASKIWRQEGGRAFWKGGPARVFRSSPQFGVTLLTYEIIQRYFYFDFGGAPKTEMKPVNPDISLHADHIGGLRLAVASFAGIETKFGLCLPVFQSPGQNVKK